MVEPRTIINSRAPEAESLQVSAKDLQLTCSGPAVLAGGSTGTSVTNFKRFGSANVATTYSGASQTTLVGFGGQRIIGYGIRQDISGRISSSSSAKVQDKTGKTEQGSVLLSANQTQLADDKSIKGLLAAPCIRPQSEFWLVGGSTSVGREALLILTNPSAVDATVDLSIYTENGASHSAGLSGISVRKNSTTVLPMSSFVLRAQSLAVHLKSFGGSITAVMQQKAIRGIKASGADYISPNDVFEKESFFPGILVRGALDSAKFRKKSAKYSDVQNMLRVFVPGEKDANLTFQVIGTDEQTFGTAISVKAEAGKVTDFEVTGLRNGDYFGILNSDVPVKSSFRLVRAKSSSAGFVDFAWINSASAFDSTRFIAVPDSGVSKLSIVNPGTKQITVVLRIGAAKVKRTVAAASAEVIALAKGLGVGISPSAYVYANLVIDNQGRVATLPVVDEKNISGQVTVSIH
ncbi:MAG: DUF5719 family protein [Rhodoluna sp.]